MMLEQVQTDLDTHIRLQAHHLLRQSEHFALAGNLADAQALLMQVWDLTNEQMPRFANAAAWHLAWLLLRVQAYAEAAEWFQRVAAPMADEGLLWDTARQAQVRICQMLATTSKTTQQESATLSQRERGQLATLSPLSVTSLGSFSIACGGRVLGHCKSRKAIALLRYLLLQHNREATKEQLVETFWPDTMPKKSMHSLHVAVKALRQYLDPHTNYILFDLGTYFIHPEVVIDDDRSAFIDCCAVGDRQWAARHYSLAERAYQQAITYYSGDYYVNDYDCVWALTEQEHLLSKYLTALERIGDISFQQGAYDQAMTSYQRLLQRDEYREDIHSRVMHCCQRLGRRRDALLQYQRCALALKRDLGIEPMQETQAIYREIMSAG
jgi:DNA-binding SARP family transcriptional activator